MSIWDNIKKCHLIEETIAHIVADLKIFDIKYCEGVGISDYLVITSDAAGNYKIINKDKYICKRFPCSNYVNLVLNNSLSKSSYVTSCMNALQQ